MSADSHLGGAPAVESVEAAVYTVPTDAPEGAVRGAQGRCTLHRAFRHDQRPLGEAEGAFLLCGFMMALAEHQQGHTAHAPRLFERNRAACTVTKDVDRHATRQHEGEPESCERGAGERCDEEERCDEGGLCFKAAPASR